MSFGLGNQLASRSSRLANQTFFGLLPKRQVGNLPISSKSSPTEAQNPSLITTDGLSSESTNFIPEPLNASSVNASTRASSPQVNQPSKESHKRSRRRIHDYTKDQDLEQVENSKKNKREERRRWSKSLDLSSQPEKPLSKSQALYSASSKNFFKHVSVAQYHQPNPSSTPSTASNDLPRSGPELLSWRLDRESFSVAGSPRTVPKKAITGWPVTTHPGVYRPGNFSYAFHDKSWRLSLPDFVSLREDVVPDGYKLKPEKGRMMLLSKRSLSEKMVILRHFGWELVEHDTKMRKIIKGLTDREQQRWMGLSESRIRMLVVQWLSLIGQSRKHDPDEVIFKGSSLMISLQTHEARIKPVPPKTTSDQESSTAAENSRSTPSSAPSSLGPSETPRTSPGHTPGITPSDIALAWSIEAFLRDLKIIGSKPPVNLQTQPYEWTE